jgi:hypothetical protein
LDVSSWMFLLAANCATKRDTRSACSGPDPRASEFGFASVGQTIAQYLLRRQEIRPLVTSRQMLSGEHVAAVPCSCEYYTESNTNLCCMGWPLQRQLFALAVSQLEQQMQVMDRPA